MSIILRGKETSIGTWEVIRIVEVAQYHHNARRVESLVQCFLRNNLEGKVENYLYLLHPGNVSVEQLNSWPMPFHPDEIRDAPLLPSSDEPTLLLPFEPPKYEESLLQRVYGPTFVEDGGNILWNNRLSASREWVKLEKPEPVSIWPQENRAYISKHYPVSSSEDFIPFTVFKFGPFTKKGPVLFSLGLVIEGATYNKLVGDPEYFCNNGPDRALSIIKYDIIDHFNKEEGYIAELEKFTKNPSDHGRGYIDSNSRYDIIILNNSEKAYSVRVDLDGSCEVAELPKLVGTIYATMGNNFKLSMSYKHPVKHMNEKRVLQTAH